MRIGGQDMLEKHAKLVSITIPLVWGFSYIFMIFGIAQIPTFELVTLRCSIAFLVMGVLFFKHLKNYLSKVLLLYSAIACLVVGVTYTDASTTGFLQSTTVVIVPLMQVIFDRKLPQVRTMLACLITLVGLALLSGAQLMTLNLGAIAALLSAVIYAGHILFSKFAVQRIDATSLGILQLGFASLYGVLSSLFFEKVVFPSGLSSWIAILGLALLCSAYGFVMLAKLQSYVSAEFTGFMFSLEPVFTAIFAMIIFGESLQIKGYFGAILILIGVLLASSKKANISDKEQESSTSCAY